MQILKKTVLAAALSFVCAGAFAAGMTAEENESYSMGASVANYLSAQMSRNWASQAIRLSS